MKNPLESLPMAVTISVVLTVVLAFFLSTIH